MTMRGNENALGQKIESLWEDGIIDWVLRERRPVIIEDMETLDQPGVEEHTFVMIPLIVRGTQIGIYVLHCKKPRDSFTAGELELLGVLANHAGVAIEHSRLYNDLESTNAQLKESQDQILMSAKLSAIGELAGGGRARGQQSSTNHPEPRSTHGPSRAGQSESRRRLTAGREQRAPHIEDHSPPAGFCSQQRAGWRLGALRRGPGPATSLCLGKTSIGRAFDPGRPAPRWGSTHSLRSHGGAGASIHQSDSQFKTTPCRTEGA